MRAHLVLAASFVSLGFAGCLGPATGGDTDGAGRPHDAGPRDTGEPAPRALARRAKVSPALLEVARLEDAKERANGRLAALLVGDPDAGVRRAAAMALGHIHHPDDAAALMGAFGDRAPAVAEAALFATGLLHDGDRKAPAAPLLPLLSHESPRIRAAAVEALGRIGDPTTAEAVHDLVADPDATVRGEAALAAWRLVAGAPAIPKLGDGEGDGDGATEADRARHAETVAIRDRVYAATLPIARAASAELDAAARWRMIYAVAGLRRPTPRAGPVAPALTLAERSELATLAEGWLSAPDHVARGYAALAVGRVLGPEAGPALAPALADPHWTVRIWALEAAREPTVAGVLAPLRALAAMDPHPLVRARALEVLAGRGDEGAIEIVLEALAAESPSVRRAALGTLGALQKQAALPVLRRHLQHDDVWTRTAAIAAAGAALPEGADVVAVAMVEALLLERFQAGPVQEQAAAIEAASALPVAKACELAVRGLAQATMEVRGSACDLIKGRAKDIQALGEARPDLWPALQSAWERSQGPEQYELRQGVLDALVALGDARALPLCHAGLDDAYRVVRESAASGIEKLTGTKPPVATRRDPVGPGRPDPVEARALDLPRRFVLVTRKGEMVLELFIDDAPLHCLNFVMLARTGFYDGLTFHRVVPSFVIQGGCPRGTGWGDPGYTLNNEVNPRRYVHGTIGMPDSGLDSGGCQLFIDHVPTPHLDGRYTVFGQVVKGLDVVDRIEVGDVIVTVREE